MTELVYENLGGTPFEDVLADLPSLQEIYEEVDRDAPELDRRERHELIQQKLAAKGEAIAIRNARNAARWPIIRLAEAVDRYIALEERPKGPDGLAGFIRAEVPRRILDRAAGQLELTREGMWHRFEVAVATAKRSERWQRNSGMLDDALNRVDWDQREEQEFNRSLRFPRDQKRWSSLENEELTKRFTLLWDEGIEPPTHGGESGNRLLTILSDEFGRTQGAIWQRLVRMRLVSAIPKRNEEALVTRRQQNTQVLSVPESGLRENEEKMYFVSPPQVIQIANALRQQTVECLDYLILKSSRSSNYYLQFPSPGRPERVPGKLPSHLYAEAVSNEFLEPSEALSVAQQRALKVLGWSEPGRIISGPESGGSTPNWWRIFQLQTDDQFFVIAATLYETLTKIYGHKESSVSIDIAD